MVRVYVKAKPNSRQDRVVPPQPRLLPEEEEWYTVEVREPAMEGRATEAVMELLAEHFGVSRSRVKLLRGATSRRKVFEIKEAE